MKYIKINQTISLLPFKLYFKYINIKKNYNSNKIENMIRFNKKELLFNILL